MEEFRSPDEFPNYGVNSKGEVWNLIYDRPIQPRATRGNPRGSSAQVTISDWDGRPKTMSLSRLVADLWLPKHEFAHYDTPINLNGDRFDNRVENLQWRPRWYAIQYHQQFHTDPSIGRGTIPILNVDTEDIYQNADVAFTTLGLIRIKMIVAIFNKEIIRPDNVMLQWVNE